MEDVDLAAVREPHRLEPDGERSRRQLLRRGGLRQRRDSLEPREAASRGRERALPEVRDPAERLERPDELEQQRLEEDELPDRQVPLDHLAAAEEEDGGDRERRQIEEPRQVLRLDAGLPQHGVAHRAGAEAEALAHVVLASERLHHLDPDDRFVRCLGDVALPRLHLARDRRDVPREPVREQRDRRHRDRGEEREQRVDDQQRDRDADDHHHALHSLDEPPADEVADRVEVVRRAREHLARGVAVVERARETKVRAVEELAHPRLDPDPDPCRRVPAREVDSQPDRREDDDREEVRPERVLVRRRSRCRSPSRSGSGSRSRSPCSRTRETRPWKPSLRSAHQSRSSLRKVGLRPRSGGST